jgi:uncharacterized protein YndB with AHSA1/START domain
MPPVFNKSLLIQANPESVWQFLTSASLMTKWMSDPGMDIEVITDWRVGRPIVVKGFHHVNFENHGTVLHFEPFKRLQYTHLSSVSNLPESSESYCIFSFDLESIDKATRLSLTIENSPDEVIFKHLQLYWNSTLNVLKQMIESG